MKALFSFLSLIVLTFAVACAANHKGSTALGQPAPEFTLKDTSGTEHSLSDFKGKWVVLEWVNYGCPFVKKHYKNGDMQKLQEKYTGKDVVWLSICSSAPGKQGYMTATEATAKNQKIGLKSTAYLLDEDGTVGKEYGARTTPQMYVISPEGELVYMGAIDSIRSTSADDVAKADNYVADALDAGMAGQPIAVSQSKPYGCGVKY